jgi:5'-nucleotidase
MRILLTNDDGIDAPGLIALYAGIRDLGDIQVVAPATVQSAMSHAVTFTRPITATARRVHVDSATPEAHFDGIAVAGSPADCVKLALSTLLTEPVDLVISGMNAGANIGVNVTYSGTVAAALEAGYLGVPAIAVSLHVGGGNDQRFPEAVAHARAVIDDILSAGPLQRGTVLNLNVPILEAGERPRGVKVTPVSVSASADRYEGTPDADGATHYASVGGIAFRDAIADTDVAAIYQKYITVSPLTLDRTAHEQLRTWTARLATEAVAADERG